MGVKIVEIPKESAIYYLRVNYKGFRKTIKIGTNKKLASEAKQKTRPGLFLKGLIF